MSEGRNRSVTDNRPYPNGSNLNRRSARPIICLPRIEEENDSGLVMQETFNATLTDDTFQIIDHEITFDSTNFPRHTKGMRYRRFRLPKAFRPRSRSFSTSTIQRGTEGRPPFFSSAHLPNFNANIGQVPLTNSHPARESKTEPGVQATASGSAGSTCPDRLPQDRKRFTSFSDTTNENQPPTTLVRKKRKLGTKRKMRPYNGTYSPPGSEDDALGSDRKKQRSEPSRGAHSDRFS